MSPLAWVAFVAAGALGAPLRYLVDGAVQDCTLGAIPLGTLVVYASGSLVLGFLAGLAIHHGLDDATKIVVGTGFCGAFTTFSTFSYETVRLIEDGAHQEAIRNLAGNLIVGALAAATGLATAAVL